MKRKDVEKICGEPMFPRLHVNDTEKGGPRAPPRNKMALYEHLCVPSQRFNHVQGSGLERSTFFPHHLPSSTTTRIDQQSHARQSNDSNFYTPLVQLERGDKVGEEDEFQAPVFVQSRKDHGQRKALNTRYREKLTPFSPSYSICSTKLQSTFGRDAKHISSQLENSNGCMLHTDHSAKSTIRKMNELSKAAKSFSDTEHQDHLAGNISRLHESDQHERSSSPQSEDSGHGDVEELTRYVQSGSNARPDSDSQSGMFYSSDPDDDNEYPGDHMRGSQPVVHVEKSDDVSETSMVDSVSVLDFSPDDVVGIIGQKRFWKARRAIVNQQRAFAVQVFELHRLIKVQKLIAGSPHLLHEDSVYLGKPSLNGSPVNKLPDYVVGPLSFIIKRKNESEKSKDQIESSAENTVRKTYVSVKNGIQLTGLCVGNRLPTPTPTPTPTSVATDNMNPWCFQQTPGHQWLIPVMTPTEGLVYKPYPGSGFMGGGCGGFGSLGPIPFTGNFMSPGYGVPAHHQGMGFLPCGVPVVNTAMSGLGVEQMNQLAGPVPDSHGQYYGGGANNMQHQSSCNVPTQKSWTITQATKVQVSKDSDVHGSTVSCLSERAQDPKGTEAQKLFIKIPAAVEGPPQTLVIRVVPHNPRSASESAARIFQSIQKERKHYDYSF